MRSILRFALAVVPTAALAGAVVLAVSRNGQGTAATSDGDLQRDLKLASSTTLELAPAGQSVATVSAIEAPPAAAPERAARTKKSSGPRAIRSRSPVVRAAPEADVAESAEESETDAVAELTGPPAESTAEAPAEGGVALPRPTAMPVSLPGTSAGTAGGDAGGGVYGDGGGVYGGPTVIRGGGGVYDDPCRIHGPVYGRPPIYRRPRGISLGDRIRAAQGSTTTPRTRSSIGDRIREAQGRSTGTRSAGTRSKPAGSSRGSVADRVRAARGR